MGRPVVLSNGSLFVGLNEQGQVHDFYYPYVGLDNLTTARSVHHKIGVWVDGTFGWLDDDSWEIAIDFEEDALVSNIIARNNEMKIELKFHDFVDYGHNAFCRFAKIINHSDTPHDVRVFFHQVFQISRAGRADTALFVPEESYLLDYKGRTSLLIYGQRGDGQPFDQYAVGNYGIEGKQGTYFDAEDGELSGNPVEHGGVDSVLRISLQIEAGKTEELYYWVVASSSQQDALKIHSFLKTEGLESRLSATRAHWHAWLRTGSEALHKIDKKYLAETKKSLLIVKAHTDRRGGILASGDSSIFNYGRDYYCYCWPRDGAYAIWPLIRLGYEEEPKLFFNFCRDVLHPGGYLEHKYQPDRAIGSTWHPLVHGKQQELAIQEDETAIVIYMLGEFYVRSKDKDYVHGLYATLVQPAANFMSQFIDEATNLPHASYDLWEEKFATHTYTVFLTQAALRTAAKIAEDFDYPDDALRWMHAAERILKHTELLYSTERGTYRKSILLESNGKLKHDDTIDTSSLYAAAMFVPPHFEKERLQNTAKAVVNNLMSVTPSGGVPRYEKDWYMRTEEQYTGNPWFVCTLWLAQFFIRIGLEKRAVELVDWSLERVLQGGVLSEQIHPATSAPVGVAPLVWSHAEFVNTVLDLAQ